MVKKSLNKYLREFQAGRREGSVVTSQTVESLLPDEKETWREIRKELEEIGISVKAFDRNRDFIINWFKESFANGDFGEQMPEEDLNWTPEDDLSEVSETRSFPVPDRTIAQYTAPPESVSGHGVSRDLNHLMLDET